MEELSHLLDRPINKLVSDTHLNGKELIELLDKIDANNHVTNSLHGVPYIRRKPKKARSNRVR